MLRLTATYFATALAIAALDIVWLTQFGPKVYFPTLDPVALPAARLGPAVAFYIVYVAGVLALAIWPTREKPLLKTTGAGAMLGGLCYATYDLTNQATLKVWAVQITLIDITWGAFLTAVGATAGGMVVRRMRA